MTVGQMNSSRRRAWLAGLLAFAALAFAAPEAALAQAASSDATLSGLSAKKADDTVLPLTPAFDSATVAYAANTLESTATSAKVTATVNDSGASLAGSLAKADGTTEEITMTSGTEVTLTGLSGGFNVLTITVTAEDASTQDYTLELPVSGAPVATIDQGDTAEVGAFADLELSVTARDPDGTDVTYSWTATDPNGNDGSSALSGTLTSDSVTFNATTTGDWIVTVEATSGGDGVAATITITVLSADATLSALAATDGAGTALVLAPPFASGTTAYTTTVGNSETTAKVTATVNHSGASLTQGVLAKANGSIVPPFPMTSGTEVELTGLALGHNMLTIGVRAEDGATEQSYTLRITRLGPPTVSISPAGDQTVVTPNNLTLDGSASEDPDGLTPGETLTYDWSATLAGADVTDTVFPDGTDGATAVFTTTAATTPGDYAVTLEVTDDEIETSTAMLTVTVTDISSDATLSALTLMDGAGAALPLTPAFDSATLDYTASMMTPAGGGAASPMVTATVNQEDATLAGSLLRDVGAADDVTLTSAAAAALMNLALGDNVLTITVTAEDGTEEEYTLTITVSQSNDAMLSALTLEGGGAALTLSPAFDPATTAYTATLAAGDDAPSIDVTATVSHMAASLMGSLTRGTGAVPDPERMTSGAATTMDLAAGVNTLAVAVTAEDGTTQTYTVTVTRQLMPTVSIEPAGDQRIAPEIDLMLTATGEDPDGGSVTYAWTSAADSGNMDTAQATLSGADTAMLTFHANEPGSWTVTVTVTDDESQTATASLTVTVARETKKRVAAMKKVFAATGLQMLSGVLDNVGARLGGGMPGSNLTLAGENVPLGAASTSGLACEPDVFGRDECGPDMRGASALDLLGSSAFSLAAAGASGGSMADDAPRWALWGRGDAGAFEGTPKGMSYEGETRTGWLGMDARAGGWVAGIALSHGESTSDYEFDTDSGEIGSGRIETTLTSVYPYGRMTLAEGFELRLVGGAGTGVAHHRPKGDEAAEESELTMLMASGGLRHALPPSAGFAFAVRADMSHVQLKTGDGEESIDGFNTQGWRGRAGVEASRRLAIPEGGSLEPFAEADVRQDGGDALQGTGLELAGGFRYIGERVHIEFRGRWLAVHSEEGTKEHGLSATVRVVDESASGRGLSLALKPRWGSAADGAGALWKDDLPRPGTAAAAEAAVDAELGYGVDAGPDGLLTPFVETGVSGPDDRLFRLGARYEALRALSLEVSGERRERETAAPEHTLGLDFTLRF